MDQVRGSLRWLPAIVPAALTVYFATQSGGYFPGATAMVAAELALALALWFVVARQPFAGVNVPLAAAALSLAGFAAWTYTSSDWSGSAVRAVVEYDRALLYLLVLVVFGCMAFSVRRIRLMVYALAVAIVGICTLGFISRTMPNVILDIAPVHPERLSYPLTYWNTMGILAGIGVILCGHLASSSRDSWSVRVFGAALVPLLATTLYYTFSRGGTWAALAGVVIYSVVGRPRGLISAGIATAPTTLLALMAANPANALTDLPPLSPESLAAGRSVATTVFLCMLGAGVVRLALLPLDTWMESYHLPTRMRRPVLAGATALAMAVVLAGCATLNVPGVVQGKYEEFTGDVEVGGSGGGSGRLLSGSDNGRQQHWDVALDAYRRDRMHGSGAGMYAVDWARDRKTNALAQDGHSLYLEVMGELGLPGLIMLATTLILMLGAFAVRARGPNRPLFAALLAAGMAWAVHAGMDWDWEMPAVTLWLFAFGGAALASAKARRPLAPAVGIPLRVAAIAVCLLAAVLPVRIAIADSQAEKGVDALYRGDCRTATGQAQDSLGTFGTQVRPYQVLAWCYMQVDRYPPAIRDWKRALELDPQNWELQRGLAVARASAGLDPRVAARRAMRMNPREKLIDQLRPLANAKGPRQWRALGQRYSLTPPVQG